MVGLVGLIFCGQNQAGGRADIEMGTYIGEMNKKIAESFNNEGGGKTATPPNKAENNQGVERITKAQIFKCGEGACVKDLEQKSKAAAPPPPAPTPEQLAKAKYDASAIERKAKALILIKEQEMQDMDHPIDDSDEAIKWVSKKLIESLGWVGEAVVAVWDVVDDSVVPGQSVLDQKHSDDELLVVREALDMEQQKMLQSIKIQQEEIRLQKEELEKQKALNQKAYEENIKQLKLDGKYPVDLPPEEVIIRGPASVASQATKDYLNSIQNLAALKGPNFAAITSHVIRRSAKGSLIPISPKLSKQVARALEPMISANACIVGGGSCMLVNGSKGQSCYCPKMVSPTDYVRVNGIATKKELGRFCRKGETAEPLAAPLPVGIFCNIPVDLSQNYGQPHVEYIQGRVSKYSCQTWGEKHSEHCE